MTHKPLNYETRQQVIVNKMAAGVFRSRHATAKPTKVKAKVSKK